MGAAYERGCKVLVFAGMCAAAQAQTTPALQQLNSYLNGIGTAQAADRAQKVPRSIRARMPTNGKPRSEAKFCG